MKPLYYLYYKIFKTYKKIDRVIKFWGGPGYHTNSFVSLLLASPLVWLTLKFNWWKKEMYVQFLLAVTLLFAFAFLNLFIEKKVVRRAIFLFKQEDEIQSIKGALIVNAGLAAYLFLWIYTLYG